MVTCFCAEQTNVEVSQVVFWLSDDPDHISNSLSVVVYSADAALNPNQLLYSEDITGYLGGQNAITLNTPVAIPPEAGGGFCVGVESTSMNDAVRLFTSDTAPNTFSFLKAPLCRFGDFTSLASFSGNAFCIEATAM